MSSAPLLSREAPEPFREAPEASGPPPADRLLPGGAETRSPLFLEGWLEFNRSKWGVQPYRWRSSPSGPNTAGLEAVFYLDAQERVVLPRLNAYMPVAFRPTPSRSPIRIARQRLEATESLAREMCQRRLGTTVLLPPEVSDIRPWIWAGLQVGVFYTFHNELPVDTKQVDPAVRKKCQQAKAAGYRCTRGESVALAWDCVRETERRQGFAYGMTPGDLEQLSRLLGEECFRTYLCYSPAGQPVSMRLVLHRPGGRAVDWVCGTASEHLQSGATQWLLWFVLEDLHAAGAAGFDFAGASIRNIAAAKMNWGGRLVPYYSLQADYNLRTLAKWLNGWLRYCRTGQKSRRGASRDDLPGSGLASAGRRRSGMEEAARD